MSAIDIIIPVFNPGRHLRRCLQSVSNQSCAEKFRVILIDDGSTEKIESTLRRFKNLEILYIKNRENKGAAFARNVGIKHSTAELIFFLDADDEMRPDRMHHTTDVFQ